MAKTPILIDIYVALNEEGNYECGTDLEEAIDRLNANQGSYMVRTVKFALRISPPEVQDIGEYIVPDEAGTTELQPEEPEAPV